MTELSSKELELLGIIYNDKFAVGAFSGMIYNSYVNQPENGKNIDQLLQDALRVRLRIKELVE